MACERINKKTGVRYYLHCKERGRGRLYFFSKLPEGAIELPEGMEVGVNSRTGLPIIRKIKALV